MRIKLFTTALSFIVLVSAFTGCQGHTDQQDIEVSLAPIHDVQVNIAKSNPAQVFIYIKGGLKDGCTTFHDLTVECNGNTINITVTTERPRDAICAQVYGYFEKYVALGSDFTLVQTYTVNVNGITTSFEYS